jgi:hypothetical protein
MADVLKTRVRERGPTEHSIYERTLKWMVDWRERAFKKAIVLNGDEHEWDSTRQGRIKWFINRETDDKCHGVLRDWSVFLHDIKTHSGAHRHQGGLVIYVIEGEGYTEVDGERKDWQEGDALLLPLKPDGVLHKHFNKRPGQKAVWIAFIYSPYMDELGKWVEQKEVAPDFRG